MILIAVQWSFKKKPLFLGTTNVCRAKGVQCAQHTLKRAQGKKNVNACSMGRGKKEKEGGKTQGKGRAKRMNYKTGGAKCTQ